MDPEHLPCNLEYRPSQDEEVVKQQQKAEKKEEVKKDEEKEEGGKVEMKKEEVGREETVEEKLNKKRRPPLREKGYTHFIQIPLSEFCGESFKNMVATQIDPNDSDALVDPASLHITLMVLRVNKLEDIIKWEQVVKGLKLRKARITVRGVGIFPVKPNTNFTRVLYAKV